jgi:hypothetical protein
MPRYKIKNWDKHQTFRKDRNAKNAPWIKLKPGFFQHWQVQKLDVEKRYILLGIFAWCDKSTGIIEKSEEEMQHILACKPFKYSDLSHFLRKLPSKTSDKPVVNQESTSDTPRGRDSIEIEIESTIVKTSDEDVDCTEFLFPLKNGDFWPLSVKLFDELQEGYSKIDIKQALHQSRMWLLTNTHRRKTARGMPTFLNNWLSKASSDFEKTKPRIPTNTVNDVPEEDLSQC